MFLCLKRNIWWDYSCWKFIRLWFGRKIFWGNLVWWGWRFLYIEIYEVWWGLNWFWVGRKIFWKNLVWRILYIGIYKVWWCLNWLVLEYCRWKWVFEIDKNVSLFKEVWWDYSCWKFIRLWFGRKIFWENLVWWYLKSLIYYIYEVWLGLNWLVLEYCRWKWIFGMHKIFKEVWWDYSC